MKDLLISKEQARMFAIECFDSIIRNIQQSQEQNKNDIMCKTREEI